METATLQLLAEMDATDGWPAERWAGILDQTARLFLRSAENLSASKVELFDGVFIRLADRVDTASLAKLSQKLSETKCTLPQVTRRLALDENESVWTPALKSRGIAQEILFEVIQSRGPAHHLAIAARQSVDPSLCDRLIERGPSSVHHALVENLGAKMSEAGWARLAELAQKDPTLAEKLDRRTDIPGPIKRGIHARVEDAHMRLLSDRPRVMRDRIEDAVASSAANGLFNPAASDLARAQAKMVELARQGKLKDSTVNRFAAAREYVEIVAALALLTGSTTDVVRALIASDKIEGLVLACKAARLAWGTTKMIVNNRPGMLPVSAAELEKARETFQSFCLSAAQQTVRF